MLEAPPEVQSQTAAEYDKWRRRGRYYDDRLTASCRLHVAAGARVLELGCGNGDLLAAVRPARGVGIDRSEEMVACAQQRHPELEFLCLDAQGFQLDERFDYVVLSNVLHEVQDVQAVLANLPHVCHERTRILIHNYNYLWEPILRAASRLGLRRPLPCRNWLDYHDVANLLEITGFRVIRRQMRVLLPKRIPLVSDLVNRYLAVLPLVDRLCLVQCIVAAPQPKARDPRTVSCSVVIPTKDERGNVADAIRRTPHMGRHTEFLFVDGHSTDGTIAEIQRAIAEHPELDIRFMLQDGKGKGDAVRKGFAAAKGDVLMILDSDLTMPPEELPKYFDALVQGRGEFVNGCRLVYQLEKQSMRFLNILANKAFALIFCWLLEQRVKDTLCGTKVLCRADYERIAANRHYFGDFDPFGDFDLLFGAAKLNLKIVEIPIRYQARTYGEIKIRRFKHGWLLLRMCVFAFRKLKV